MSNEQTPDPPAGPPAAPTPAAVPRRLIILAAVLLVAGIGVWGGIQYYVSWADSQYGEPPEIPYRPTPFVPTPHDVVDKMLELVEPKPGELLYDLGSGDGRIVVKASKRYGCRSVGFEFNDELVKKSQADAKEQGVEKLVTIEKQDFYTVDLSKADVITIYLLPRPIAKLRPQLEKLKSGTRVVCHDYGFPWLTPDSKIAMRSQNGNGSDHFVFLYVWK
jgi:protein-L-isoaspartate O-methyltransferase